jgi:hypothetical protein
MSVVRSDTPIPGGVERCRGAAMRTATVTGRRTRKSGRGGLRRCGPARSTVGVAGSGSSPGSRGTSGMTTTTRRGIAAQSIVAATVQRCRGCWRRPAPRRRHMIAGRSSTRSGVRSAAGVTRTRVTRGPAGRGIGRGRSIRVALIAGGRASLARRRSGSWPRRRRKWRSCRTSERKRAGGVIGWAYSRSPTASRASCLVACCSIRQILPLRIQYAQP